MKHKTDRFFSNEIEFDHLEMQNFFLNVGKKIQSIRQSKGISQLELSNMLGFKSTSLIAGAEAGYNNIKFSLAHLYKISKVLNVNVQFFFDFDEAHLSNCHEHLAKQIPKTVV